MFPEFHEGMIESNYRSYRLETPNTDTYASYDDEQDDLKLEMPRALTLFLGSFFMLSSTLAIFTLGMIVA